MKKGEGGEKPRISKINPTIVGIRKDESSENHF